MPATDLIFQINFYQLQIFLNQCFFFSLSADNTLIHHRCIKINQCLIDNWSMSRRSDIDFKLYHDLCELGSNALTCPRSMVRLTSLYSSPRERGGLCHHRSVPSSACSGGWAWPGTRGSHTSQSWPWITSNCGGTSPPVVGSAPVSLQNNSGSETPTPQVEVASIRFRWARLK